MSVDVSRMLGSLAARYGAIWIIWGLSTGCAAVPGKPASPASGVSSSSKTHRCGEDPTAPQDEQQCVAMICRDPEDPATCYCPATLPDGRRQPLSPEECESTLDDPNYEHQFDSAGVPGGGGGQGERGKTAKPDGTDNPFKHTRPHPTKKGWIQQKDPHTGQWKDKPAPPGWQEWWDARKKP